MSVTLALGGVQAPAPPPSTLLPRRVRLPGSVVAALARRAGTPLPWRPDPAPSRLVRALGDVAGPAAAEPDDDTVLVSRGLVTPDGAPVEEVAGALAVLASARVSVRLDLGVRRPAAVGGVARLTGWHHRCGDRVTAVTTTGGPELELAWFDDAHWHRELAHLVTRPAETRGGTRADSPADRLTLPFDLLLGAGAAVRQGRPAVLAELLARHRVLGPDDTPLGPCAAAEQVRLLHTAEHGRLQVTVTSAEHACRVLGVATWVLFADGWRSLLPATIDRVPVVHVRAVSPPALGVTVARLATVARP